jgi:hypothetical protein
MKRQFVFFMMIILVLAAAGSAWAETDPRLGTWKLNVSKSTSSNGTLAASETRTYAAEGSKIMSTSDGVDAKGKPISSHYEVTADDKDRAMNPANPSATLSIKQTGPGAYAGTLKRDGKVVSTNVAVISGGGKVFTIKTKGTDAQGQAFTSTVVFEKQ